MIRACPPPSPDTGVIRSVLVEVDCNVRGFSEAGYAALTGPHSFFPAAVTALLTIYIAILGLRLMFGIGGARFGDSPIIALRIGVILALSLNWMAFQTLVFDLATKAPLEVARTISAPTARTASLAADPVRGVQRVYDQITAAASAFGRQAGPTPQVLSGGAAAAADGLWKTSSVLFMSTAGALSIAVIAVGILLAVGPIFIALSLFEATRGLFVGWMRALVSAALAPMVCWMTTTVMLVVVQPWLARLTDARLNGLLDIDASAVVIALVVVFAAAQAAVVACAGMIGGGFRLKPGGRPSGQAASAALPARTAPQDVFAMSRVERLVQQIARPPAINGGAAQRITRAVGSDRTVASSTAGQAANGPSPAAASITAVYRRNGFQDQFRRTRGSAS